MADSYEHNEYEQIKRISTRLIKHIQPFIAFARLPQKKDYVRFKPKGVQPVK